MRSCWKFASLVLVSLLLAIIPLWGGDDRRSHEAQTSPVLDALARAEIESAFASIPLRAKKMSAASAAIVPHHLTARSFLADLVQRLPDTRPATIVIVGPDHQNAGTSLVTATADDWQSGGVRYPVNRTAVEQLRSSGLLTTNNTVIRQEHSVLVPMAFLAHRYPTAQFVLLAIRSSFDRALLRSLVDELHSLLGPNDLVIASVDFSHYQFLAQAEQEDQQSLELLQAGDSDALGRISADSPASLSVAMRFAQIRNSARLTVLRHGNSAQILGDPTIQSTTSYFTAVFSAQ